MLFSVITFFSVYAVFFSASVFKLFLLAISFFLFLLISSLLITTNTIVTLFNHSLTIYKFEL